MPADPARARPSWSARLRRVFFGKPLTHEQMKGMTPAEITAQRTDAAARASGTVGRGMHGGL